MYTCICGYMFYVYVYIHIHICQASPYRDPSHSFLGDPPRDQGFNPTKIK